MKSILKYPGAKNRLTPWICEYIPKHDVYVEPFAGSLAVFFNKQRSHIETVNSPNPARAWSELPEIMKLATERLKGVQIENLPALELIKRYDTEDVFIYADPPYLHGTRKNYLYKHEMKDADHEKLLNVLVKHPGKILLSGYDNDMYNDVLQGWNKVQKNTRAEGGRARTETLWMNYEVENGQISLIM